MKQATYLLGWGTRSHLFAYLTKRRAPPPYFVLRRVGLRFIELAALYQLIGCEANQKVDDSAVVIVQFARSDCGVFSVDMADVEDVAYSAGFPT